jgi:hypothetical protein
MTPQAPNLFAKALELPEPERDAFLAEACSGDAELRLEVQRLLVDAARASKRDHPPRYQTVEHPGHAARRDVGA